MSISENMGKRAALRGKALSLIIAVFSGLLAAFSFLEIRKVVDWNIVQSITGRHPDYNDVVVLVLICVVSVVVHVGITTAIRIFSR